MFERYTESAKRAIFYARAVTIINGAPAIDSIHLLCGLMWDKNSRAQNLFGLRERFPSYCGFPHKSGAVRATSSQNMQLTLDAKRILARTASEAAAMHDDWIGTDHLLLGILREPTCLAAQHLAQQASPWRVRALSWRPRSLATLRRPRRRHAW
jgi:ATP-dependent Clp protease ATP-binding subunit ClpC